MLQIPKKTRETVIDWVVPFDEWADLIEDVVGIFKEKTVAGKLRKLGQSFETYLKTAIPSVIAGKAIVQVSPTVGKAIASATSSFLGPKVSTVIGSGTTKGGIAAGKTIQAIFKPGVEIIKRTGQGAFKATESIVGDVVTKVKSPVAKAASVAGKVAAVAVISIAAEEASTHVQSLSTYLFARQKGVDITYDNAKRMVSKNPDNILSGYDVIMNAVGLKSLSEREKQAAESWSIKDQKLLGYLFSIPRKIKVSKRKDSNN